MKDKKKEKKEKKEKDGIIKEIPSETAVEVELRNREFNKKWRKKINTKKPSKKN